jgi:hypothetical protein
MNLLQFECTPEIIRERRRRCEATGEPLDEVRLPSISFPRGRRLSIAETLRMGRQLAYEENRKRQLAPAGGNSYR